ncbi:MAG: uroporphyrinogen-III C-methyltransferase [Ilumatobacteraceae bacterium]
MTRQVTPPASPWVSLVGAGPGDPDLLTVRAARRLAAADVVVHDALVSDAVLALARPGAELIDVGKRPGQGVAQDLINVLLVRLAREGRRVVRLKGGDPFVFGRGGEEAVALAEQGIACEVVPGISSAIGAPAAAGIPVTYRGLSASFTVVTGHRQRGETPVNWQALAQAGGTIVVLMGVAQRGEIAAQLLEGGLHDTTPVAAVHRATTGEQSVVRVPLRELATAPIQSPSVIVIGAVASLDVQSIAEAIHH